MSKIRILVVEDDGIVAADIEDSLKDLGYEIAAVVASGEEALEVVNVKKTDLVLMDIVLQGEMNGIHAAGEMRSKFNVPVVYLTAYADEDTLEKAKVTEPYGYLIKPFEDRELHTVIEMALYKHSMEKKLKESEEWFSTTLKSIGDAVITSDQKGTITFMNHVAQSLTGWREEDAIGKPMEEVFNIINEETEKKVENPVSKVLRDGVIVGLANHTLLIAKDGTKIAIDDSGAPILNSEGNIIGVVLVFRDIASRRRAEKALEDEKERLAVTLRSIGDGVITTNREGKIVLINKISEKLTGWSQSEAFGKPLAEVFHIINEKTRVRCENPVDKVLETGEIVDLANHTALIAKDGTERAIADSGAPIRDKDGNIFGVVLVFRDITEKQKMEEDLMRAKKLESVGILAGGVAHDFNNFLTSILCNISLAKTFITEEDEIFCRLDEAEKASIRAKGLTQQLLTFSKGGEPIKKYASIKDIIKDSTRFALAGSNSKVEFSFPDNLRNVEIDEGQISQVINNLILNACQAMPDGGTIKVSIENSTLAKTNAMQLKEGNYVKLSIEDQGIGISDDHLSKIFDPYFSTKQKGSGLGLATSYSIIKKHDGALTVNSELSHGTTFYIYLPTSTKEAQKQERVKKEFMVDRGKILVMDDEKIIRGVVEASLNKIGYQTMAANCGLETIDLYKKAKEAGSPFDVVIMDLTIPGGMGGKEAIKKLLELDPKAKAIVSSGYSNDPVMANFKQFGFRGILAKPYQMKELGEMVYEVMREKGKTF